jgi:hypothetical protein
VTRSNQDNDPMKLGVIWRRDIHHYPDAALRVDATKL